MNPNDSRRPTPIGTARRARSLVRAVAGRGLPAAQEGVACVSWVLLCLSYEIDLLAFALIAFGDGRLHTYLAAAAIHFAAVVVVLAFDDRLQGSQRMLTGALMFALPLAGFWIATVALGTRRQAGLAAVIPADDVLPPTLDATSFHKIAEALSPCEVLSASGNAERWATLAALIRRGDGEAVRLLRWLTTTNPDVAVDAALALEELSMRFDAGLDTCRAELAEAPSAAAALDEGNFIAGAMESGLVEPMMLEARAAEARRCFTMASTLGPAGAADVTMAWARMELAAVRPETALDMLDRALAGPGHAGGRDALIDLRDEASFASHERLVDGLLLAPPAREPGARAGLAA